MEGVYSSSIGAPSTIPLEEGDALPGLDEEGLREHQFGKCEVFQVRAEDVLSGRAEI